ncbi:non-heme iron oxygenase ferredoxin subunit [Reyranella sp. CPCC 100927]|uniref:non-heme iron oxygenase ferredoxin subunit n=1 Tax=Reyranella sp. CPCC 100927 TaxID=2599616 RepID=UPI0011B55DAB|nr:non-heme iron oxygenase ferredoxin subunit [Reyranella sp. CPCC 100927]TWT10588.1 non-heme iron oxygenase ferredoxin subunit [Reyranella sp. CPCC 100927]
MTTTWHDVAAPEDVAEDMPITVKLGDRDVGLYRLNGEFYALEDVCPHAYALLSQGFIEGDEIECPLHGAKFHIPTGRCTKEPADRDLRRYDVKLESGRLFVGVA